MARKLTTANDFLREINRIERMLLDPERARNQALIAKWDAEDAANRLENHATGKKINDEPAPVKPKTLQEILASAAKMGKKDLKK